MDNTTYNGWTNYETWAVNLWLDQDQDYWQEITNGTDDKTTVADIIKEQHEEMVSEALPNNGPLQDLLNHSIAMVDWHEIAQHLLEE